MSPETRQAIEIELNSRLPGGWSVQHAADHLLVTVPTDNIRHAEDEIWNLARFIAYRRSCCIEVHDIKTITVTSFSETGSSFVVRFKAQR
jgi:hypothetical protein